LRRRREDILALAEEFLREAATRRELPAPKLGVGASEALREYAWPGNVAELRRCMEAALALSEGERIEEHELDLRRDPGDDGDDVIRRLQQAIESVIPPEGLAFEELVADVERSLIEKAYRISDGNQSQTAKLLQLNRDKLRYRMKAFDLL
jgi:DNA-binding NtrC family response regulator